MKSKYIESENVKRIKKGIKELEKNRGMKLSFGDDKSLTADDIDWWRILDIDWKKYTLEQLECECTPKCQCDCLGCYENGHYRYCNESGCTNNRLKEGFLYGDEYRCNDHKPDDFDELYVDGGDDFYWTEWDDIYIHRDDNLSLKRCSRECICHYVRISNQGFKGYPAYR